MEPSSGQNSHTNTNDSQAQILPEEENQENDPVAPEQGAPENDSPEPTEGTESNVAPADDSHLNASNLEQSTANSDTVPRGSTVTNAKDARTAGTSRLPLSVVLTYAARDRPRQPFFGPKADLTSSATPASTSTGRPQGGRPPAGRGIPPPPSYYPARQQPQDHAVQEQPQATQGNERRDKAERADRIGRTDLQFALPDAVNPLLNPMMNPFTNIVAWAPYPKTISANVPSYLAHLIEAEVIFVVQHVEAIEFFGNLELPNVYFIQNIKGECIYYVYESTVCIPCCCKNSRALQLHVMDMYQNEVIYMKKSCGCALYFCCFPVYPNPNVFLEVYSPPSVPIGAIVKKFHPCREQFHILDADENLIFKIYGDCSLMYCSRCMQYDFTIRALDPNETEVGFIRRDFPGMYQFLLGTEYYGVSFPVDLDVRMKAVFLGALFMIDFLYFE